MNTITDAPKRDRWARLRFSIIGPLLAAPPAQGELHSALRLLAAKTWRDPVSALDVCFAASTMQRWYYAARRANVRWRRSRTACAAILVAFPA